MYRRIWWSEIQIDRRILMKRNSNRCTSIVAFWWSEIQIDRRIVIERNSNWYIVESRELERRRVCRVSPFESEDEFIESHDESEDEYVESCDYLVERRWVYRISWLLRAKTSISSLASRAKMSMSNLANRAKMSMSNPAIWERRRVCRVSRLERRWVCRVSRLESEDEYVESCNFGTITSFVAVMHWWAKPFVALCIVGFIVIYKNSD